MLAETYLWRAVVYQAFRDGLGAATTNGLSPSAAERLRCTSRNWILDNDVEFRRVCDMAEIDPDWLIRRFRQVEKGRAIFFRDYAESAYETI